LTAADRCDRCGAQAYVRARLHAGGELLFCAHHGREHLPKLREYAEIDDQSQRLNETPGTAAVEER
jgi:ribosomal protein L37E